jgi:hypothetical protein
MHRPTVGILALVLLISGGVFLSKSANDSSWQNAAAGCLRVGAILAVLWLALPEVSRPLSRWILVAVVVGIFLVARRPQLIVLALVFLAGVAILRPRLKGVVGPPR